MIPDEPAPGPKRPSMRKAVNAFCRDCIYDPVEPGTWLQQVTACTSPDCPLYPVRPTSPVPIGTPRKARGGPPVDETGGGEG